MSTKSLTKQPGGFEPILITRQSTLGAQTLHGRTDEERARARATDIRIVIVVRIPICIA